MKSFARGRSLLALGRPLWTWQPRLGGREAAGLGPGDLVRTRHWPLAWDLCTNERPAAGPGSCLLGEYTEREENVVKFPARKISLSCSFIPELEQVSLLSFTSHKHCSVTSLQNSFSQWTTKIQPIWKANRVTTARSKSSHYRSFWSHIIPLRLDLWQCVIQTLVCEEHKQNNSQLIPGPWRLEKGRGPRHSHIVEKQRSQELGLWTIALYLTPTQLEYNYLLITCKDYWLIMNLGQQSETHCRCSAAVISDVRPWCSSDLQSHDTHPTLQWSPLSAGLYNDPHVQRKTVRLYIIIMYEGYD